MIKIIYTPSFIRRYKKLSSRLKEEVKEKIKQFQSVGNHQGLKVHKLGGSLKNIFSFSVNYKVRVVFEFGRDKTSANLLLVGDHDEVY